MSDYECYTFGWHGISFDVPKTWELGKETGTRKEGYVRIDDIYFPRVEVTWRKPNKRYRLKTIYDNYIKNLKRKIKKKAGNPGEIEILNDFCEPLPDKETFIFRWGAKDPVYECVSFCRECYRLVFVRYISEDDSDCISKAKRLFSSLQDHHKDGKERWSFLGFDVSLPGNYSLEETTLNAGFIRMDFTDQDETISAMMISLAKELLEKRKLEDMIRFYLKKDLRKYAGVDFREECINGHSGCIGEPIKRESRFAKPFFPVKGYMRIFGWLCEEKNKIFIVKVYSMSEQGLTEALSVHSGVRCH